jgi:DNA replication factor GINS
MDLNELQSVQSRERQTDSLQQLRASFYRDAADYIADLEDKRDSAAQRADDPWNAPEVGRLNDDIDTAKGTVEAIYERRVGKIVKIASLAAADMPTDDEGLTDEERALFDQLVAAIEQNRDGVFAILDGEDPPVDPATPGQVDRETAAGPAESGPSGGPAEPESHPDVGTAPEPSPTSAEAADSPADPASSGEFTGDSGGEPRDVPPDVRGPADDRPTDDATTEDQHVGAADLMGGDSGADGSGQPVRDGGAADTRSADSTGGADAGGPDVDAGTDEAVSHAAPGTRTDPDGAGARAADAEDADTTTVDRSMVRITDDVGPIYGVEGREYDLTANDVVTLPEANVGPLLKQGAAERLD